MAHVYAGHAEDLTAQVGEIYNCESGPNVLAYVAIVVLTLAEISNGTPAEACGFQNRS